MKKKYTEKPTEYQSVLKPKAANTQELYQPFLMPETAEKEIPLKFRMIGPIGWAPLAALSRLVKTVWMNVENHGKYDELREFITTRPDNRKHKLITITAHQSTIDDPFITATLFPYHTYLFSTSKLPWSIAGHNVLFTTPFKNWFFSHGRAAPAIRGLGVYQRTINFLARRLQYEPGFYSNFYSEGTVNMFKEPMNLKWGVARLIIESLDYKIPLEVRIVHHDGLDDFVSPWRKDDHWLMGYPPVLTRRHNVTFNVSSGYNFDLLIETMRKRRSRDSSLIDFQPRSENFKREMYGEELQKCEERAAVMGVVAQILNRYAVETEKIHDARGESVYLLEKIPLVGKFFEGYRLEKTSRR